MSWGLLGMLANMDNVKSPKDNTRFWVLESHFLWPLKGGTWWIREDPSHVVRTGAWCSCHLAWAPANATKLRILLTFFLFDPARWHLSS
jgi:hypothetical protein